MLRARIRAVLLGICSLLLPGLGQVLLRRWVRALLFAGALVATFAIFVPEFPMAPSGDLQSTLAAAETANAEMSTAGTIAITAVQFAAMMDAYVQALAEPRAKGTEGPTCPRCGREVEPSHGFCQWCTYEFEEPTDSPNSH
jgi:hypothetical protein